VHRVTELLERTRQVEIRGLTVNFKLFGRVIFEVECDNELEVQRIVKEWLRKD